MVSAASGLLLLCRRQQFILFPTFVGGGGEGVSPVEISSMLQLFFLIVSDVLTMC